MEGVVFRMLEQQPLQEIPQVLLWRYEIHKLSSSTKILMPFLVKLVILESFLFLTNAFLKSNKQQFIYHELSKLLLKSEV